MVFDWGIGRGGKAPEKILHVAFSLFVGCIPVGGRYVFANLSSGEVHMMVGDASRQRCPLEEGMRPEDQERGRDRKKKKWERQTRSLFVAFYEGVLFVGHPCVYVPILCYTDTAIQQTRTTKELNEQSTINRMNRINRIIISPFPSLILLFILAIAVYSKLTSTSRPPP